MPEGSRAEKRPTDVIGAAVAGFVEQQKCEAQEWDATAAAFIEIHNTLAARYSEWAERLW